MTIADPSRSRVVLVASSRFCHPRFSALPSAGRGVSRLAELLGDPDVWGLPAENCTVLHDPESAEMVLDEVRAAARAATDTLIFYYSGHGQVTAAGDLLLALPRSDPDALYRSLAYDQVRQQISSARRCPARVVILDCCFSARGMAGSLAVGTALADRAGVAGSAILAAAAETVPALAPAEEEYTAFTGELIRLLESGISDGPPLLTLEAIFWAMRRELRAIGRPVPEQQFRHSGNVISFARNRWSAKPVPVAAAPAEVSPEPDGTPREVLGQVVRQRASGDHAGADAVLTTIGRLWPGQRVTATIALLLDGGRDADLTELLNGLSVRPPDIVQQVVETVLQDYGQDCLGPLSRSLRLWPVEPAASLVIRMWTRHAGRDLANRILAEVASEARGHTSRIIDLIAIFLMRECPEPVGVVLEQLIADAEQTDLIAVADAFHSAGQTDAAYRLYACAVDLVAAREDGEVLTVARGFRSAGLAEPLRALVGAALSGRPAESDTAAVIARLAVDIDLHEEIDVGLAGLADHLDCDAVLRVTGMLRAAGADREALVLLGSATQRLPIEAAARLVNGLVEEGWPEDALTVLRWGGGMWTAPGIHRLLGAVVDTPRLRRTREVFDALSGNPVISLADLVVLTEEDHDRSVLLQACLIEHSDRVPGIITDLSAAGHTDVAGRYLDAAESAGVLPWEDLRITSPVLLAVSRAGSPALSAKLTAVIRSRLGAGPAPFVLAAELWRQGLKDAAAALIDDRLRISPEWIGDPFATAVAEILNLMAADGRRHSLTFTEREVLVAGRLRFTYRQLADVSSVYAVGSRLCFDDVTVEWPAGDHAGQRAAVRALRRVAQAAGEVLRFERECNRPIDDS